MKYFKEFVAGDPANTIRVDQDGIEWLSASLPGFTRVRGRISTAGTTVHWPAGADSRGAPLYAYYAKPGIFDAGICCTTRDGRWRGFFCGCKQWHNTDFLAGDAEIDIEVSENHVSVALYSLEGTKRTLMQWLGHPAGRLELDLTMPVFEDCVVDLKNDPFYQMATIAFHENNELEIPENLRRGIAQRGMRFHNAALFSAAGEKTPWRAENLKACVWGRTEYSRQTVENPLGDWSDVTVTNLET